MKRFRVFGALVAALLLLGACTSSPAPEQSPTATPQEPPASTTTPGAATQTETETEGESEVETEAADAEPAADADEAAERGPAETFLAWLEASRIPDTEVACGYMTAELIEKMIAEFEANYGADPGGCEGLTELTADLYRTFNQSAEVSISVVSEDETDAVLHVTYVENGDCATVVLEKDGGGWIMNEHTTGCHQP